MEAHALLVRPDYAANFDNYLLQMFRRQREVNIAFIRPHSGHYPWSYQDAADETGMLIQADRLDSTSGSVARMREEFDENHQPTPALRGKMIESLEAYWNHPSVVCYSLRNEMWDSPDMDRSRLLDALHDLCKQINPYLLCGTSSGRRPVDRRARCDYYDGHFYVGYHSGPVTVTAEAMAGVRRQYYQEWWGVKPMLNGECGFLPWHRSEKLLAAFGGAHPKRIDRTTYTEVMREPIRYVFNRINAMGLRNHLNYAETRGPMEALWFKRYIEQYRYAEGCRGFNLHQSPYHYIGPAAGPRFEAFRSALSPLWIGKASTDRNFYIERRLRIPLLAINDSRFDLTGVSVRGALIGPDGVAAASATAPAPSLTNGRRAGFAMAFDLPADLAGGDYHLRLTTVGADGKELHRNRYLLHMVRREDIRPAPKPDCRVALYGGAGGAPTIKALESLGADCVKVDSFDKLGEFNVLILAAGCFDGRIQGSGEKIHQWLKAGGKLLCLEQGPIGVVPWMKNVRIARAGLRDTGAIFADIIAEDHPVFRGWRWHEFDLWNGRRGQLCDDYILPLSDAVLAASMFQRGRYPVGMAAAEFRIGRGVCLMSQIEAVRRFGTDPVASKYLSRLLRYVVRGWDARYARRSKTPPLLAPPDPTKAFVVGLAKFANARRRAPGKAPRKRIWLMNSRNDMEDLPTGRANYLGVPFEILPAEKPSCIAVGPKGSGLPAKIEGILVRRKARRVFFLIAAAGVRAENVRSRTLVGTLRIRFGPHGPVSREEIPLVLGENIIPFDDPGAPLLSSAVGWTGYQLGHYRGPDKNLGLALIAWENPTPEVSVESLSLLAGRAGAAVLVGVTVER